MHVKDATHDRRAANPPPSALRTPPHAHPLSPLTLDRPTCRPPWTAGRGAPPPRYHDRPASPQRPGDNFYPSGYMSTCTWASICPLRRMLPARQHVPAPPQLWAPNALALARASVASPPRGSHQDPPCPHPPLHRIISTCMCSVHPCPLAPSPLPLAPPTHALPSHPHSPHPRPAGRCRWSEVCVRPAVQGGLHRRVQPPQPAGAVVCRPRKVSNGRLKDRTSRASSSSSCVSKAEELELVVGMVVLAGDHFLPCCTHCAQPGEVGMGAAARRPGGGGALWAQSWSGGHCRPWGCATMWLRVCVWAWCRGLGHHLGPLLACLAGVFAVHRPHGTRLTRAHTNTHTHAHLHTHMHTPPPHLACPQPRLQRRDGLQPHRRRHLSGRHRHGGAVRQQVLLQPAVGGGWAGGATARCGKCVVGGWESASCQRLVKRWCCAHDRVQTQTQQQHSGNCNGRRPRPPLGNGLGAPRTLSPPCEQRPPPRPARPACLGLACLEMLTAAGTGCTAAPPQPDGPRSAVACDARRGDAHF